MNEQFEYRSLYFSGLPDGEDEDIPNPDSIAAILKERGRAYNRLGAEGWGLVAEHLLHPSLAAIATFRRANGVADRTVATDADAASGPAVASAPASGPAYPIMQPDPSAPGSFRLVWDK